MLFWGYEGEGPAAAAARENLWAKGKMTKEVIRHPLEKSIIKVDAMFQGRPGQGCSFSECNTV